MSESTKSWRTQTQNPRVEENIVVLCWQPSTSGCAELHRYGCFSAPFRLNVLKTVLTDVHVEMKNTHFISNVMLNSKSTSSAHRKHFLVLFCPRFLNFLKSFYFATVLPNAQSVVLWCEGALFVVPFWPRALVWAFDMAWDTQGRANHKHQVIKGRTLINTNIEH